MSDGKLATGLLSDLRKLDEAGRDRILNLLSPENVKDILKASLREHERTQADSTASQDQPHEDVHRETIRVTDVEHGAKIPHEQDGSSIKRGKMVTILRYRKRPRIEEKSPQEQPSNEKEIAEIESDEDSDKSRNMRRDNPPIVLQNERAQQGYSIDNDSVGPIERQEKQPKILPTSILVDDQYIPETVLSFGSLPNDTGAEIKRRLDNMWSSYKQTITEYTAYTQNLKRDPYSSRCIHNMLIRCSLLDGTISDRFTEPRASADKTCIVTGYPCARLKRNKYRQEFSIWLAPLPMRLRKGKSWDELGYWVLPKADTVMAAVR